MKAYVSRNVNGAPSVKGPLLAEQNEFMSRHGIPVFFAEHEIEFAALEGFDVEEALPGMVGIGFRDQLLYTILRDGSLTALPLQVINVVNEYPRQPRRTSEQTKQLRHQEQQERAV